MASKSMLFSVLSQKETLILKSLVILTSFKVSYLNKIMLMVIENCCESQCTHKVDHLQ